MPIGRQDLDLAVLDRFEWFKVTGCGPWHVILVSRLDDLR
jgi:hypothetical protein